MSYNSYNRRPSRVRSFSPGKNTKRGARKKDYIHPSRFIKSAKLITEAPYIPANKFSDFDMHPLLHANLVEKGFTEPSPIQDQTIPVGLAGKDIVGIADTGTGKTAAFAIPILHQLITNRGSYALILAPTRELALQIEEQCRSLAKGSGLHGAMLIGGVPYGKQLRELRDDPRIVIGTPGRIKDHAERGSLKLSRFNIVVLDEVDRMLEMGFINDILGILGQTDSKRQSLFFSATLDEKIKKVIGSLTTDPTHVIVKNGETSDNVDQNLITYRDKSEKVDKLHDLLIRDAVIKSLVFDDTHRSVEALCKELQSRGFETDAIHGGKTQAQRQRALKRFKDNEIKVLVATDVAARGIDVADISHVINFSTPQSYSDYIHRIGRAGRAGQLGYALTFVEQ